MFDLTHLGHAGWMVQDRNFKAIFDPWLSPKGTFFNSWHQFPDNSHMISDTLFKNLDFIYISHAHKDHYDPWTLHLVDKTTPILIPEFKDKTLRQNLQKLGFTKIEELLEEETFAIKGVKAQVIIEEGFNDRDSAIILCNESNKIINLNDCHPSFEKIKKYSENVDLLLLQSSSAIWWPCVYDYNFSDLISKCKLKRNNVLNRTLQYAKCIKPKFVVPNAGPPVFLHDQFRFWDETRDESFNPFLLLDDVLLVTLLQHFYSHETSLYTQ